MPQDFYTRLRQYYEGVAKVIRGDAEVASIFPNSSDIGTSRERIYAEFLRLHAPSKCNVFLGGFLFHEDGSESRQLDVIVTTDTAPRFNFHNPDGGGKSFSPVEGTLGVASIKSTLDKDKLIDALEGLASIPPTKSLANRIPPTIDLRGYDDWPYKIIYAKSGLEGSTILRHLQDYYAENNHIPIGRRPNIIHVAGKYIVMRAKRVMTLRSTSEDIGRPLQEGEFFLSTRDPDVQGILWVMHYLQQHASASSDILYNYGNIINKIAQFD